MTMGGATGICTAKSLMVLLDLMSKAMAIKHLHGNRGKSVVWSFIVYRTSSSSISLRVNGEHVEDLPNHIVPIAFVEPRLGAWVHQGSIRRALDGRIGPVRIWSAEVDVHTCPASGTPDLLAAYDVGPMVSAPTRTLVDHSGYAHDGEVIGATYSIETDHQFDCDVRVCLVDAATEACITVC